jgi:serine/threonine protein phosphatase PrpC
MPIHHYGQTDIGRRRKINEDSIFRGDGLFIVCDGMGGHKAGEVASSLAVEAIVRFIERSNEDRELTWPYGFNPRLSYNGNRLLTAVKLANRTVHKKANSGEDYTGMGTTVAAVLVPPGETVMTHAHVGDSRIYLLRDGAMLQLTRDDSWANVAWGGATQDESANSLRNVLTKALGARDEVDFDVVDQALSDGDTVLLCSDGLTNMLPDRRILEIVMRQSREIEGACRQLVDEANAQGGRDNISVILVQYRH